jgi:hypothetical protein
MAGEQGFIPLSGPIKASDISRARGVNNCEDCTSTSVFGISSAAIFFEQKASMPELSATAGVLNFSDFREASVTTGCIVTISETYSQYSKNNNGRVRAYLDCNTIVTDLNQEKVYSICIQGDSGFVEKIEDVTSPNGACRCRQRTGINGGSTCHVKMRDGLNDDTTVISFSVYVGYNDATRYYNCIQRTNSI